MSSTTLSEQITEKAYILLDEMDADSQVDFSFERCHDGSYMVAARHVATAHIANIGNVERDEETKKWVVTLPLSLNSHFRNRESAAAALWEKLTLDWREAARSGQRTTEGAVAERTAWIELRFGWLVEGLEREIERSRKALVTFAQELIDGNRDPVNLFTWATSETMEAAKLTAFNTAVKILNAPGHDGQRETTEQRVVRCREYALEKVFDGAHSPARSTSPMANLMEQQVTAAWALVVDHVREYFRNRI